MLYFWLYFTLQKSIILAIWNRFPESLISLLVRNRGLWHLLNPDLGLAVEWSCAASKLDIWAGEGSLAQLTAWGEAILESSFFFGFVFFFKSPTVNAFLHQKNRSTTLSCKRDWNNRVRVYLPQYILDNYKWFVLIIHNILIVQTRVENGCVKSTRVSTPVTWKRARWRHMYGYVCVLPFSLF